MIKSIFIVGLGGMLGSMARYVISFSMNRWQFFAAFPLATLLINLTGCLLIGVLSGLYENKFLIKPELRIFLFVGVLGGFTTFSAFGLETWLLLKNEKIAFAILNCTLQVFLGLSAVWLGNTLTKLV